MTLDDIYFAFVLVVVGLPIVVISVLVALVMLADDRPPRATVTGGEAGWCVVEQTSNRVVIELGQCAGTK